MSRNCGAFSPVWTLSRVPVSSRTVSPSRHSQSNGRASACVCRCQRCTEAFRPADACYRALLHRARNRWRASRRSFCTRQKHEVSDEASAQAPQSSLRKYDAHGTFMGIPDPCALTALQTVHRSIHRISCLGAKNKDNSEAVAWTLLPKSFDC
jgi:hypothetical protein